ncbi:MAG: pilus assembly protein [Proteobacteria bacterium]|nr:MAG: pilus assembly protein [Pseudomonadota bacterium]
MDESANKKTNESGQAILEFVLSMFFLLSVLLFTIQLTLFLAFGNYIQYATFMAARAYQSAGLNANDQVTRAQNVLNRTVKQGGQDRLAMVIKGQNPEIGPGSIFRRADQSLSWQEGVRYDFKGRLFIMPLGPVRIPSGAGEVDLTSEAWLGREPTYEECKNSMPPGAKIDNGC